MDKRVLSTATISAAVFAALLTGCSSDEDTSQAAGASGTPSSSDTPATTSAAAAATPTGPPPTPGQVVLSDEMDDDRNGWGTGPGVTFEAGEYVVAMTPPAGLAGWPDALLASPPKSVVVTATVSAPEGSALVGVTCNNVMDGQGGGEFYSLSIGSDVMLISRTSSGDRTPDKGQILATTETGVDLTTPHQVQAACVPTSETMELWLSVDGEPTLSAVDDDPLGEGPPGVQLVGIGGNGASFQARMTSYSVAEPA
ncbi:hypothetical protein [Modestobacter excelsi]|uniref:hypothetical protein n=1 Tax=Modestobacter excelsi TaxID=2213161 RepID=UPI00110CCED0|nr:hypothetical protein [Modestobacter excelsi]